ncbi:MAG: DUF3012 domain-containing protein [Gammaproteobacteria bacterium]|nr:DUF3012 domain-containing protein [Gammaproteobacteria bacterium]
MKNFVHICATVLFVLSISACAPEVGSDAWCKDMQAKSKADWTANEAKDYATSCLFDSRD